MNDVLVSVDAKRGILRRYVTGGGPRLLTHEAIAVAGGPVDFTAGVVEGFRVNPPEHFRVATNPFNPPPPAGGTPAAARVAA